MKLIEQKHPYLDQTDDSVSDAPLSARDMDKGKRETRILENEKVFFDEEGKKLKGVVAYRKFVRLWYFYIFQNTFFNLTVKDYFGGKVFVIQDRGVNADNILEL